MNNYFNNNIKEEYKTYKENIGETKQASFRDQFKLASFTKKEDFSPLFKIGSDTTYNVVEPENFTMYEHQNGVFNPVEMVPSGRRDNTLIINDYHTDITTQYAIKKKEVDSFYVLDKNPNALTGSTPTYLQTMDRYNDNVQYKNNQYLPNTRLRPEAADGTPITEDFRVKYKNLEQLRGKGVNSQRLASEGKLNENGQIGEGVGVNPEDVKVNVLSNGPRYQSFGDLLRTTGSLQRHEWRSMVRESDTARDNDTNYIAAPGSLNSAGERRYDDETNPTHFEDYMENIPTINSKTEVGATPYRSYQEARSTQFEEYMENIPKINSKPEVSATPYRSHQEARSGQFTEYMENIPIINTNTDVKSMPYRSHQAANPTQFEEYAENIPVINSRSYVGATPRNNYQAVNPTNFEEYAEDIPVINSRSYVGATPHKNYQAANPTNFEEYVEDIPVINSRSYVGATPRKNYQAANPTHFEEYVEDIPVINTRSYIGATPRKNYQPANPTHREDYIETNYVGVGNNVDVGIVYNNGQATNPKHIEDYVEYEYILPGSNQTATYRIGRDKMKQKILDQFVETDYKGVQRTNVNALTSHSHMKNIRNEDRKERALDHRQWEQVGGKDQVSATIEHIGDYEVNGHRENKGNVINRGHFLSQGYKSKYNNIRGKSSQNARQNIDGNIEASLQGNPYVNNVVHFSNSNIDIIDTVTNIFNRGRDESDIIKRRNKLIN